MVLVCFLKRDFQRHKQVHTANNLQQQQKKNVYILHIYHSYKGSLYWQKLVELFGNTEVCLQKWTTMWNCWTVKSSFCPVITENTWACQRKRIILFQDGLRQVWMKNYQPPDITKRNKPFQESPEQMAARILNPGWYKGQWFESLKHTEGHHPNFIYGLPSVQIVEDQIFRIELTFPSLGLES